MGKVRLIELVNREPAGSERLVVARVNGEEQLTIEPGRSINLTVEEDGILLWIGRKVQPPASVEEDASGRSDEAFMALATGDTAAPTGDETDYDPTALTDAILNHIDLLPDAPATEAEVAILDAIEATNDRLDQIDAELRAGGVDPNTLSAATKEAIAEDNAMAAEVAGTEFEANEEDFDLYSPANTAPDLTKEGLEAMTFSQLRELGYQLNVKGTSKAELVRDILAAITPAEG